MAIDGVGRAGPPLVGVPSGVTGPQSSAATFQVGAPAPSAASGLLARLQGGELSLDQYLDGHVEQAVAPFQGRLSPEQLETLRDVLREQAASDPVLVEWVRRATGSVPVAPSGSGEGDGSG